MVQFNETYDNELLKIKETYKSKFPSILLSKNHPEFKYLVDYINENTPLLNSTEFKYSFTTRVYWVLNHLTDFPKCKNSNCQYTGKIVNWNIPSISKKYKDFCCEDCRYKSKEYKYSIQNAFQEKYGENIKNAYQIQTVKDNLKSRKEEISNKRKQTKNKKYADENWNNSQKATESKIMKYGSVWNINKAKETKLLLYDSETWNNPYKNSATKLKNKTFNSSNAEEVAYRLLKKFKYPDLIRQYKSNIYNFNCDFYSKKENLYIEYMGSWTHGQHAFNEENQSDIQILEKWKSKNSKYYDNAINTWTKRDVAKRKIAKQNNLNYIELWNIEEVLNHIRPNFDILSISFNEYKLKHEFQLFSKQQKITEIKKQNNNNFIVKYFQQDTFFKTEKQLYLNKEIREKLENNREKYLFKDKSKLSSLELLDGFKKSGIYYGYSHFNPYWFKFFIDRFNLNTVYDPCGGWGHRLLGGLCLQKYIYNDLSKSTKENVDKIIQYFNIKNTETYNFDARTFIPEENFEAMFTCPPYFNVEHYECGDFESRESFDLFIDKLFEIFYKKQSCKYFGLVIREDLLGNHNNYFEKFLLSRQTSKYLTKKQNENNEYLYVFCK